MTEYMQVDRDGMYRLLAIIAGIDFRTWPDDTAARATAALWHETIRRELAGTRHFTLGYALAEEAVYAWYGRDRRRITPADLIDTAAEIRAARLAATPLPDPPEHPAPDGWAGDDDGWRAMQAAGRDVIADGGTRDAAAAAMAAVAAARPRQLDGARP